MIFYDYLSKFLMYYKYKMFCMYNVQWLYEIRCVSLKLLMRDV